MCCKLDISTGMEKDLIFKQSVLIKITGLLFLLISFPSFVLTFSYNSCVTFQGAPTWIDFFGVQIMFIAIIQPLINGRFYESSWYWIYHSCASFVISLIQFGAFLVHTIGMATDGDFILNQYTKFLVFEVESGVVVDEIKESCFKVTYGAIYYTLLANLVASVILMIQFVYACKLYMVISGSPKFCCFKK